MTFGIRLPVVAPDELAKSGYRIINDLRNALDQAAYAASCMLQPERSIKKSSFPFGQSEADLRGSLRNAHKGQRFPDLAPALFPHFVSLRPWRSSEANSDGNDILHTLGSIANPNKHLIPIEVTLGGTFNMFGASFPIVFVGNMPRGNGEIELYKVIFGHPFQIDCQFHPQISFG